jgi:hypothetical protein
VHPTLAGIMPKRAFSMMLKARLVLHHQNRQQTAHGSSPAGGRTPLVLLRSSQIASRAQHALWLRHSTAQQQANSPAAPRPTCSLC